MPSEKLNQTIRSWQETRLGVSLQASATNTVPVLERPTAATSDSPGLVAVRFDGRSVAVARRDWVEPSKKVVSNMHPDLLFTAFGAYELSRVTLPDGASVWGPNWYMFADSDSWQGLIDDRVTKLNLGDLGGIDFDLFWHCYGPGSMAAFAVYEGNDLVALSTVTDRGTPFMEIGVDVVQGAQSSGLGLAVVSAAGNWIIEQGGLPLATVAPFNVPSTRTLRRAGLEYGMTEMSAVEGPFRVPPQPMGRPLPDADIYDYYPDWAMNKGIRPRSELRG